MWKLLRNLMLAAILVAGILKLLAWYEVGQDAQRLTAALEPYAKLHYDGIAAGLDGSVSLSGVSVAIKRDKATDTYSADSVALESPNVFWLLKHALFDGTTVPPRFGFSIRGLKFPATTGFDSQWINPATLVPFENAGCTVANFAPPDYRQMGVSTGDAYEHGEYHYDLDTKTLSISVALVSPGFANWTLESEVRQFDPEMIKSLDALKKLHIEQLSADYVDNGYMQRRNKLCAQRGNIGPVQFAEQHVAAVQAFLQQHNIEPSAELLKLYRHLVENGGRASVLSLPNSNFVADAWLNSTPEDLLRQLNVTARYGDTPPVMFRLSFTTPADVEQTVAAATVPASATVNAGTSAATSAPTPTPVQTPPAPIAAAPPSPTATKPAPTTTQALADKIDPLTSVFKPASANTVSNVDNHIKADSLGMRDLDRAEAKLPPPPKPVRSVPDFLPSEPAPAPGTTLALVWKPTIERLPAAAPQRHDYDVIDFASLKSEQGRRVRLVTDGGKKIEGYVIAVDDGNVQLRVNGGGGDAEFTVPKSRIREIQLIHHPLPPA